MTKKLKPGASVNRILKKMPQYIQFEFCNGTSACGYYSLSSIKKLETVTVYMPSYSQSLTDY